MTWWQLSLIVAATVGVVVLLRGTVLRPGMKVISTTEVRLLKAVLAQFQPNSSTTMRDAVDRLEKAVARLETLLATTARVGLTTAAGITRIEKAAASVADDLSNAHDRADATDGVPGAAADAAAQSA